MPPSAAGALAALWLAGAGGCEPHEAAAEVWARPSTSAVVSVADEPAPASAAPPAAEGPSAAPPPPRLGFVGDLALTMLVGHALDQGGRGRPVPSHVEPGFPFQHVAGRLQPLDLVVGNLECVLSDRGEVATDHNPFRCSLRAPDVLRAAGVDVVSVANNHALDFGHAGFGDMVRRLERSGMPFIGLDSMRGRPTSALVRDVGGVRVALLGYPVPGKGAVADVAVARREADLVVVFNHWGGENVVAPTPDQVAMGRRLVDAGADLVVGTHAHVLQPLEWYRGRLIAYGLGNFVFDAMFDRELHRVGALLELELDRRPDRPAAAPPYRCLLTRTRLDEHGVPHLHGAPEPCDPPP